MAVRDDASDDAKERALQSIDQLGKRLHSTTLLAVAYHAAADPSGKTRGMVVEKDLSERQEACATAMEVLREDYEGVCP